VGPTLALLLLASLPSHDVTVKKGKTVVKHKVFITIDDHPTRHTDAFLAVLKKCKLKATFFVLGAPERYYRFNKKWPNNITQHNRYIAIHKAGHTLANHGVTHRNMCKLTKGQIKWELRTLQKYLWQMVKVRPKYWRAPFLVTCGKAWRVARRLKLRHVSTHIDDIRKSARYMWNRLRLRIKRKKPSTILLFHNDVKKFKAFLRLSSLCTTPD
jgi:peptidoglycan/xylan/chitin deacetylase (PgdA/CDA1 family)